MMDLNTRANNHSFHNNLPLVFNCTACQAAAKKVNGLEINGNYCHMFTYKRCNNCGDLLTLNLLPLKRLE